LPVEAKSSSLEELLRTGPSSRIDPEALQAGVEAGVHLILFSTALVRAWKIR
jgi:hypothetical protein